MTNNTTKTILLNDIGASKSGVRVEFELETPFNCSSGVNVFMLGCDADADANFQPPIKVEIF